MAAWLHRQCGTARHGFLQRSGELKREFGLTSRRELLGVAVGGLAVAVPLQYVLAAAATLTPTQTMGPFYPITRPLDIDADLTVVQGQSGRAQGKIVHLMGRVLDRNGAPVRNAKIELWQCNSHGRYAHPADVNPAPLDPNFQGFGVQTTNAEGEYRFKTIKPAAYPIGPMNPDAIRTPHIHFDISGASTHLVTQMYFPGEPENDADNIFSDLTADERIAATASLLPPAPEMEPDSLIARWDIVLRAG